MAKNEKRNVWIGVAGAVLILAAIIFYFTPTGQGFFFGQPRACVDDKTDPDCYCSEGEEQLVYERPGADYYYCESLDKAIDPTDQTDMERAAKQKLNELFPACDMKDCDKGDSVLKIGPGINVGELDRTVYAECYSEAQQAFYSRVLLDVETGEVVMNDAACIDYFERPEGTGSIAIGYLGGRTGCAGAGCKYTGEPFEVKSDGIDVHYGYTKKCAVTGDATSEVQEFSSPGGVDILEASFSNTGVGVSAETVSIDGDTIRWRMVGECPGNTGGHVEMRLKLDQDDYCRLSTARVWKLGDDYCRKAGGNSQSGYRFSVERCMSDGTFSVLESDALTCDDSVQPAEYTFDVTREFPECCVTRRINSPVNAISSQCVERERRDPSECLIGVNGDGGTYEYLDHDQFESCCIGYFPQGHHLEGRCNLWALDTPKGTCEV